MTVMTNYKEFTGDFFFSTFSFGKIPTTLDPNANTRGSMFKQSVQAFDPYWLRQVFTLINRVCACLIYDVCFAVPVTSL